MSAAPGRVPAPDLPAGPRSALIIATTNYEDPQLRQLRAPATDAVELVDLLANPAIGGFEVTSVLDRTAHAVRIAVEDFLNDRTPEDLVLVYLSCHGVTDARRRLYFAAADTSRSRLASTGIESVWVNDRMEECRARRQVLVLDCCFSGAFARGAKGADVLGLDHLAEPGRGRAVLTASNATEYSFETPTSWQPTLDSPAPGSVFTAALLAGLRDGSADRDGDGYVTVDEAYAYAYEQVRASGAAQTPQRWLSGGEGQLLLARNPAGRPVIPATLPESLRAALDSPWPNVRIGGVEELHDWLTSDDRARVATAIRELERVADNDMPRVATAARSALRLNRSASPSVDAVQRTEQARRAAADSEELTTPARTELGAEQRATDLAGFYERGRRLMDADRQEGAIEAPGRVTRFDLSLQRATLAISAAFLAVGVLGFVPGITTDYEYLDSHSVFSEAYLIGIFQVSGLNNTIHLLSGVVGILMARSYGGAQKYMRAGGAAYLLLFLYGLLVPQLSTVNFVPLNLADDILHLIFGSVMVVLSLILRPSASATL